MKNSEKEIFIDQSMFGNFHFPNDRIINFFLGSLIFVGFVLSFAMIFYRHTLKEGVVFVVFVLSLSAVLRYQAGRCIMKLQLASDGVRIQTSLATHHYSPSEIHDIILRHIFLWPVITVTKASTNKKMNYYIFYCAKSETSPMSFEATLRDAIMKYKYNVKQARSHY